MTTVCRTNNSSVWRVAAAAVAVLLAASAAEAQTRIVGAGDVADLMPVSNIARNSVSQLFARGDTLWVGPLMHLTFDGGDTWYSAEADSITDGRGRMFSMHGSGNMLWVGIGYSAREQIDGRTQTIPSAGGFVFSEDAGLNWSYRPASLFLDNESDTLQVYGVSTLPALPIITPQQSPPYDIHYDEERDVVWAAAWASGIRKSADRGLTWDRVVLPPDTLDEIHPDQEYSFTYSPQRRPDEAANNFLGFSVMVDRSGTVWAGTAAGINRSLDGGESWRRFYHDGSANSPNGNWITAIDEQPLDEGSAVWFAGWPADASSEMYGITVTRDGGSSFEQMLIGEQIYDFAFRGSSVFAAGNNGLFISEDGGRSWRTVRHFRDEDQPDRLVRPDAQVFAVEVTSSALWVGTNDGLLRSEDDGETWRLFRAEVPLRADQPDEAVPLVDTYAYPNPYAPASGGYLRIRYELERPQAVNIRIFDFGMNLVRTVTSGQKEAGVRENAWDGTDDRGLRVANGPYFYAVEADEGTFWGKILVIE